MKNKFMSKIYRQKDLESIAAKLTSLGNDTKFDTLSFCNTRLFTTLLIFIIILYVSDNGYIYAPFVAIGYYYLFYYNLYD